MNDTIIFLHLPRTGGTTLRDILSKQYSNKETFENKTLMDTDNNFNVNNIIGKEKYKLVKGHVYFGIHKFIPQKCKYFSMMRDPIERNISLYNYIKNHPTHKDTNFIKNMSIDEWVQSGRNIFTDNGQTRLLAGRIASLEVPFGEINQDHLQQAKDNIYNYFILVGLNERYDETLLLLQKLLYWKTPTYSIANAVKRGKNTTHLTPEKRELIVNHNRFDIQLYQYVSNLFDEQISKNPEILKELEKFELKNRLTGKFQISARLKRKIRKWTKN